MSILKGILHHWNKTSSAYDTIHPETEVAQVTDWNTGIVNTLASTALGTLVSTLTSDSLLATMIQKVLTATGVKYNIAKNGYLCFGSLFGGLIIQWVKYTIHNTDTRITLPVSCNTLGAVISWENGSRQSSNIPHPSILTFDDSSITFITTFGDAVAYALIFGSM